MMDICAVDQVGCEDPELDEDMAAHILQELDQNRESRIKTPLSPTPHTHGPGSYRL